MANARYFSFVDRYLRLNFFESDPVTITLTIGDDMDTVINALPAALKTASSYDDRVSILQNLVGKENAGALISRVDEPDAFALDQILLYIQRSYIEGRSKNLQSASTGRTR